MSSTHRPPRNVKTAQIRVIECLNYWMSLPDTAAFVKGLVEESYSRAGISSTSSTTAGSAASPGKQQQQSTVSIPTKPSPPKSAAASTSFSSDQIQQQQRQQQQEAATATSVESINKTLNSASAANAGAGATAGGAPAAVAAGSDGSAASSSAAAAAAGGGVLKPGAMPGTPAAPSTTNRHPHHSPTVQHFVDEMDFAHRIGAISPRHNSQQMMLNTNGNSGGNSPGADMIKTPTGSSAAAYLEVPTGKMPAAAAAAAGSSSSNDLLSSSSNGSLKLLAPKSPKLTNFSLGQHHIGAGALDLDPSAGAAASVTTSGSATYLSAGATTFPPLSRAKSPEVFPASAMIMSSSSNNINNSSGNKSSDSEHHHHSDLSASTSMIGGDARASSIDRKQKIEETARIEAAVKRDSADDPASLPKATLADIPRFYVPASSSAALMGKSNSAGSASTTPTSSTTSTPTTTIFPASGGIGGSRAAAAAATGPLLFPASTSAACGTSSGLTEQQEVAVFTRIVNALANAGARKVPPKSAGAKISRTPTAAAGGMTPLNAIVQITTESFGLPGVFAKIVHAKLVHGGKGNPQVPLTLATVKAFYDNYINGNSIERRMFEVLLGASEVNFPVPAATTMFGGGGGAAAGAASQSGAAKRPGTASSRTTTTITTSSGSSHNNFSNSGGLNSTSNDSSSSSLAGGNQGAGGRQYLIRADFAPLVQILLDHHPGLAFLKQTADFQSRYLETVIIRIFFELDRNDTNRITWEEFRRSSLPVAVRKADSHEDINLVLDFFSYEHFYVLYCRFWELDTDKDFLISKDDLVRYYPENTLNPMIVDRIVAGVGRPLRSHVKGRMNFEDFVWFCLCEEYKAHPRAIAYWFRILDVDQDGIISGYELEVFYAHTKEKMKMLTTESIVFEDVMCQVSDMMSFSRRAPLTNAAASASSPSSSSSSASVAADSKGGSRSGDSRVQSSSSSLQSGNNNNARPGTAGSRPRSAAPTGSAARLMSAAPSSRPVVGTDPHEARRLSVTSLHPSANPAGAMTSSSSSSAAAAPPSSIASVMISSQQRHLHAGFTLSDFLRCPTAAHVAINMLTNVSKFLQFEQRDPFVATQGERAAQQQHAGNLNLDGMGSLLNPHAQPGANGGPLERTEWDRFCRAEYDRMAADDDAPM